MGWDAYPQTWRPFFGGSKIDFFVIAQDDESARRMAWLMVAIYQAKQQSRKP